MTSKRNVERRYTLNGVPAPEEELREALPRIGAEISALPLAGSIRGVYLGGGYGRGEGGAFRLPDGSFRLYNDLDFFVVTSGCGKRGRDELSRALEPVARNWAERLRLDVDFFIRDFSSLRRVRRTLMYQELLSGFVTVAGDPEGLRKGLGECDFTCIPPAEAARLMMNRGCGLALAGGAWREREKHGSDKAGVDDFISRNLFKVALGCGDAFLLMRGALCPGLQNRILRLRESAPETLVSAYEQAVCFKGEPFLIDREKQPEMWRFMLGLWLENMATLTGVREPDGWSSVPDGLRRAPWPEGCRVKNLVLNWIAFRLGLRWNGLFRHPRAELSAELFESLLENFRSGNYINESLSLENGAWMDVWKRFN